MKTHQVLIIGAGAGGLSVASRLVRAGRKLDVAVVDAAERHYYQPLWTLVGGGIVPKKDSERPQRDLIPPGVTWIQKHVGRLRPGNNEVETADGEIIKYDYLVVAPGIQLDWHKIEGLSEALGTSGVCSNYSYAHLDRTWEFIRGLGKGTAIFTFPSTPVKCAGAPQKIMYLAEHHFRRAGVRDRMNVVFASAGKAIFGVPKYAAVLDRIVRERGILTRFGHDLVKIDARHKIATFERSEDGGSPSRVDLAFDLLHVTPPMSAPDFVKASPLAGPGGWVVVDKHTLQHRAFPNVFSLGDASSLPTSRTGAAIRKQAPVLVENLLAVMKGRSPSASYDGYTSCPLVTAYGKVVLAEFDYDGKPVETFPFDQGRERRSMYLLKRHLLPRLYWHGMLRGRA